MQILVLINQKGGVGKTTLAYHLAMAARKAGRSVLAVDFDTQGHFSVLLSGDPTLPARSGGAEHLLDAEFPIPTETPSGVELLHGHQYLDALDSSFDINQAIAYRDKIRSLPYDLVIFDVPPSVGFRHLAPLRWAHTAILPLEPETASVLGLGLTYNTIRDARAHNHTLRIAAVVNKWPVRSRDASDAMTAIRSNVPTVLEPYLPDRQIVTRAWAQGRAVWSVPVRRPSERVVQATWLDLCQKVIAHG